MEFLKKHYEKILLSVILLVLAVAAVMLSIKMRELRSQLQQNEEQITQIAQKAFAPLDLRAFQKIIQVATNPPPLNITSQHLVFNPVKWYKKPDNSLIKVQVGNEVGIGALEITKITPLNLIISLDAGTPGGSPDNPRYKFNVERQGATNKNDAKLKAFYAPAGGSNAVFTVKEVKGEKLNPSEILLTLADGSSNDVISVSKEKPYSQVTDYAADMRYPPEMKDFPNLRAGSGVTVGGQKYYVIAITDKQVVMSAESNQKCTIIPYSKTAP